LIKMFSKVFTSAALVLALVLQASAHAAVAPALGVAGGTPVRANVQRPSTAKPCGTINIASTINSATTVAANAAGVFTVTGTDFNAGADGSRQFTAKVDPTGKGTSFVAAKITTNGIAAPTTVGSQSLVVSLPANTKCTGGTTGNKCLVSFVSTAGFGNCVVVTQAAAAAKREYLRTGTLAARAVLAELSEIEARAEEGIEVVKRGVSSWFF
jgi:hypothetical protein